MTSLSTAVLDKLRRIDTPTVCNLVEQFDVRPRNTGYMDARIQACYPDMPPIVGYAATATFRSAAPPRAGDVYASLVQQVERFAELSGPPIVVFQDLDNPPASATFGEVMCTTYKAFGAQGLITSGAGRDLDQVYAIGFPVFTNGTMCAHGYSHTVQTLVPVHVGGITVYPDDLLHADRNGVTTIPLDIADELADLGDEYMAAEGVLLDVVRGASPTVAQLREARAEMDRRIAAMRTRVSRKKPG